MQAHIYQRTTWGKLSGMEDAQYIAMCCMKWIALTAKKWPFGTKRFTEKWETAFSYKRFKD